MTNFIGKKIEEISSADIDSFMKMKIPENQYVDYKREMYAPSDEGKREMLKDIASFANAYGGCLFIGIDEDGGSPNSIMNIPNAEDEKDRLDKSCLVNIEPRISGLKSGVINMESGEKIILIVIPRSSNKPHMITFKGLYQFWIRHQDDKNLMSIEEIRDTFLSTRNTMVELQTFLKEREKTIFSESGVKPFLVIGSSPSPLAEDIIDIRDIRIAGFLNDPPEQVGISSIAFKYFGPMDSIPEPSLMGMKCAYQDRQIEVYRNGYYEVIIPGNLFSYSINSIIYIHHKKLIETVVNYFRAAKYLFSDILYEQNVVAYINFFNIKDYCLEYGRKIPHLVPMTKRWKKNNLLLPLKQLVSLENSDTIAESFLLRFWNAFGYDDVPHFENHIYKPRS